jgi:hypothetical protein
MLVVKIITSIIFLFFGFYFLILAANDKGKGSATVTNFIIGTTLALLTLAMWYLQLG